MAIPTSDEIRINIQAADSEVWNEADQRPVGLDLFENDLAKAIKVTWTDVEEAFSIASVLVTGGSSSAGGPLEDGEATLSKGMLTNAKSFTDIENNFSSSFPDGATEELLALVKAISLGIGQNFDLWVAGYSATLVASGGTCSWVAGPTPTSGPWENGSIQSTLISSGASIEEHKITTPNLESAIKAIIKAEADLSILIRNQNTFQPALRDFIKAVAEGFAATWKQWKSKTKISGGTGTGVASPPDGSVLGTVISPLIG